jgi:hypothetical protein
MEERERKTRTTIQKRFERERFFLFSYSFYIFFPVFSLSLFLSESDVEKHKTGFIIFIFSVGPSSDWAGPAPPLHSRDSALMLTVDF